MPVNYVVSVVVLLTAKSTDQFSPALAAKLQKHIPGKTFAFIFDVISSLLFHCIATDQKLDPRRNILRNVFDITENLKPKQILKSSERLSLNMCFNILLRSNIVMFMVVYKVI